MNAHRPSVDPNAAATHFHRGNQYFEFGQFWSALASYDAALAADPCLAMVHSNRGTVLRQLERRAEALQSYERAIALHAGYAEAYFKRGVVLHELGRSREALASLDHALAQQPDHAEAQCHKAYVLLSRGEFARGLAQLEWRWKCRYGTNHQELRAWSQPLWLGDADIAGKTLLLHAEQGLGDTVFLVRYVAMAAAAGARVVLEVQPPLVGLLGDLPGVAQVVARGAALPPADFHCPLMSLPLAFKTRLQTIPAPRAYLHARACKVRWWELTLGRRGTPRLGLVWRGNPRNTNDRHRSVALVELLSHLPHGWRYVSLQKDISAGERRVLSHAQIANYDHSLHDLTDTAALCECMDAVVSVDTCMAHVSAALGKPTAILVPFVADWRWLVGRADTPWYPTARLYRQRSVGDWGAAFQALRSFPG